MLKKSTFREIKSSLGRYLAILAIVALGVGFFAGLKVTQDAMVTTTGNYLEDQNFFDYRVLSTLGLEAKDVDTLSAVDGVNSAEGSVSTDALYHLQGDENDSVMMFHTLPKNINRLILKEGRMPEKPDEIVIDHGLMAASDIGTVIEISPMNDEDRLDMFACKEYTVVGTVVSPLYLNFERGTTSLGNGTVKGFAYLTADGFDTDYFTEVYIDLDAKGVIYSEEYESAISDAEPALKAVAESCGARRYETIRQDALEELAEGQAEYDENWATYLKEKADAEAELADAYNDILEGQKEIKENRQDLEEKEAELKDTKADLLDKKEDALSNQSDLEKKKDELLSSQIQLEDGLAQVESGLSQIDENLPLLADALKQIADGLVAIEDGHTQLDEAEKDLKKGLAEYEEGKALFEAESKSAKETLANEYNKIIDGQKQLEAGREQIDEEEAKLNAQKADLVSKKDTALSKKAEFTSKRAALLNSKKQLEDDLLSLAEERVAFEAEKAEMSPADIASTEARLAEKEADLVNKKDSIEKSIAEVNGILSQIESTLPILEDNLQQVETGFAGIEASRSKLNNKEIELEKGMAAYEKGKARADAKISAGEATLANSYNDILTGQKEIQENHQKLNVQEAELKKKQTDLLLKQEEALSKQKELEETKKELLTSKVQLTDGLSQINAGLATITDNLPDLEDALKQIDEGLEAIKDGYSQLDDAEKELQEGLEDYYEGKAEAEAEFADAEAEFADARLDLEEARDEIDDIDAPDTYLLDRMTNVGYACFESDSAIVDGIAKVFPIFFFLVAALVCMTTMTRMVDEQRTQIGVLKALGYSNFAISAKYLFYSGSAALIGCTIGFFGGCYLFPKVIWIAYGMMYDFSGQLVYILNPGLGALCLAVALLCSMGATLFSCYADFGEVPAQLIRPKAPKDGKRILLERIGFIWNRLGFLYKVSFRNIFRYKKRFFMMVLGISGCTALLVAGLGINDSVKNVVNDQYDQIQLYDCSVTFDKDMDKERQERFVKRTSKEAEDMIFVYHNMDDMVVGNREKDINLVACDDPASMKAYMDLHTVDGEPVTWPQDGEAVICNNLADDYDISIGDKISLRDENMHLVEVTVSDIYENFVYNYVLTTPSTLEAGWGYEPEVKTAYVHLKAEKDDDAAIHQSAAHMMDLDRVVTVTVNNDLRNRVNNMMQSMNYVIILVVVCAGALAFIVLYNLTNINITERIREIATIKVLGFYPNETSAYVFRENIFLTAISALVGLGLGKWLLSFIVAQIQVDLMCFKDEISILSYTLAFVLTFVFSALVSVAMYGKLNKISMTESLKSIE